MKGQKINEAVKWNPQYFFDEEFDPIIPSENEDEDIYEAQQIQDEALAETVKDLLDNSQMIDATDVHVEANRHVVTLMGTVPDQEMVKHTEEAVRFVEGVAGVHNHLSIE